MRTSMNRVFWIFGLLSAYAVAQTCPAPKYCADTSTGVKPLYSIPTPPALGSSITDTTFNRKIWRITDGSTADGRSVGPIWHAQDAGMWNKPQPYGTTPNLLMLDSGGGSQVMFNANLSNPNAPSVAPIKCSYSDKIYGTCNAGKVITNSATGFQAFANTAPYVTYAWDSSGALVKFDWSTTISSGGKTGPSATVLFRPDAAGNCMHGRNLGGGRGAMILDSTDTFFQGGGDVTGKRPFIVKYPTGGVGAGCIVIDSNAVPWQITGASVMGYSGPIAFKNYDGTTISNTAIQAIGIHGFLYDPVSNSVSLGVTADTFSPQRGAWVLNMATGTALAYATPAFGETFGNGHNWGIINTGPQQGTLQEEYISNNQVSFHFVPFPAGSAKAALWGVWPPNTVFAGFDNHPSGVWTTVTPWVGLTGLFDTQGAKAPPLSALTPAAPYDGEILVLKWDRKNLTTYRFVHNYTAAGNYNSSSGQYGWGVLTAFSPDRCWAAWSSNWGGKLGSEPGARCDSKSPQACRYDTFLVYLCDSGVSATGAVPVR